jgi:hypothetical protein
VKTESTARRTSFAIAQTQASIELSSCWSVYTYITLSTITPWDYFSVLDHMHRR